MSEGSAGHSTSQLASHTIKNTEMYLVLQPLNQSHFLLLNLEFTHVILNSQVEDVGNSEHCFHTRSIYSTEVKTR